MKLYRLIPSEFHKDYIIKDTDYEFDEEFEGVKELKSNWEELELEKAGGGKNSPILFCFDPNGILFEEELLPTFEKHFENDNVEFLPLKEDEKTWYIMHCCDLADLKHTIDEYLLGNQYYIDKNEFITNEYDTKNVFKLLGKGVVDVIEVELYTEKMVNFINSFGNVGVCFEAVGEVKEL